MKPETNSPVDKNAQVKVTENEYKLLADKAASEGRSLSNWGRITLLKELKK